MDTHGSISSSSKQGTEPAQGLKQGSKASKQGGKKKGQDSGVSGPGTNQIPVSTVLKVLVAAVKATKIQPLQSQSTSAPAAPAQAPGAKATAAAAADDGAPDAQQAGTTLAPSGSPSSPFGCPIRFQLQHLGHLLLRPDNGIADKRVQGFKPDLWQQRLLSIVDAGA